MLRRPLVRVLLAIAVLFAFCAPSPAHGAAPGKPPPIDEVMDKLDDLYRSSGSVARMEIVVTSPRVTRTLRIKAWTQGEEKALVIIEAPAKEAGIATLRVGNNLWNHLPKIGRTIRVPPSMMLGSWMGTDFTNDDLVKEATWRDDYDSQIVGWSDAPAGWKILSTAKPGVVGLWAKVEIIVTAGEYLPVEMRYFDRRNQLARVMTFDDVRVMDGRRIPAHMTLTPKGTEGKRTEMRYLEVDFDAKVPASTFSLSELERRR